MALAAANALPPGTVQGVSTGRGWVKTLDGLVWLPDEVLMPGSAPLGAVARVGSMALNMIRHSPVPFIVVPSGLVREEAASELARAVARAAGEAC